MAEIEKKCSNRPYFHENRRVAISTFQDEAILKELKTGVRLTVE
jgi:hypothetical protein